MKLKGIKRVSILYRLVKSDHRVAKNLGFDPDDLPSYETIRHFINDLLDEEITEQLFYTMVRAIECELNRYNETLCGEALEDATPIESIKGDEEAEYNDYYKIFGWKKDLLISRKHGVFLAYQNLGINEDESKALLSNLEKLQEIGIRVDRITVDGRYPTYYNIALAKYRYGTGLFYKPSQNWKHNPKGEIEEINRRYQKYWKKENFKVNATMDYKLSFLCGLGDYEWVGAYYRNIQMEIYNRERKDNDRIYTVERNITESTNGYLKEHLCFDTALTGKGRKRAFRHTTLCLIAVNAVALTRLQNGITEDLTNVTHLT